MNYSDWMIAYSLTGKSLMAGYRHTHDAYLCVRYNADVTGYSIAVALSSRAAIAATDGECDGVVVWSAGDGFDHALIEAAVKAALDEYELIRSHTPPRLYERPPEVDAGIERGKMLVWEGLIAAMAGEKARFLNEDRNEEPKQ